MTGVLPTYFLASLWSEGATCSGCLVKLSTAEAFAGTRHDTTHDENAVEQNMIEFAFNGAYSFGASIKVNFSINDALLKGTAVYVFFILADRVKDATTTTVVLFSIDGIQAGTFGHGP